MSITTPIFLVFVAAVAGLYHVLPRRVQPAWLLAASYAFYISWAWEFALVLAGLTLANYMLGRFMNGRRSMLWTGVGFNLLVLAGLKYTGFFVARLPVSEGFAEFVLRFALPVGLSFLVLQAISYLVDVQRGQMEAEQDLLAFGLYLAYFPKLLSGPIERARSFLPQLRQPRLVDNAILIQAFTLILLGFFRKKVLADPLRTMIDPEVWQTPLAYGAPELFTWLLAFSFSLYNDFAGYTNIIRGVSLLFGIELTRNFQQPYFARNFTEFWNRWHISLSNWLRDYIYFPLARALRQRHAGAVLNFVLPPMVTMLASGLWHGASWNMLLWGGLHGLYQIGERLPTLWRPAIPPDQQPRARQALGMALTFILAALAWLPFQMPLEQAGQYLAGLFGGVPLIMNARILLLVVVALGLDWTQAHAKDELVFLHWRLPARAAALAFGLLALLFVLQSDTSVSFVYQGF